MPNYIHIVEVLDRLDRFADKYHLPPEAREELIDLCDFARDEPESAPLATPPPKPII